VIGSGGSPRPVERPEVDFDNGAHFDGCSIDGARFKAPLLYRFDGALVETEACTVDYADLFCGSVGIDDDTEVNCGLDMRPSGFIGELWIGFRDYGWRSGARQCLGDAEGDEDTDWQEAHNSHRGQSFVAEFAESARVLGDPDPVHDPADKARERQNQTEPRNRAAGNEHAHCEPQRLVWFRAALGKLRRTNSFLSDFAMFSTTTKCQPRLKSGMRSSHSWPGLTVLDTMISPPPRLNGPAV
jgi:hypothetical protein